MSIPWYICILSISGGTIDITLFEIVKEGALREILPSSGGEWGGNVVNIKYLEFLEKMVGKEAFSTFKESCYQDYLWLQQDFEDKKRQKIASGQSLLLRFPPELGNVCESVYDKSIVNLVAENFLDGSVKVNRDKIQMQCDLFEDLFTATINSTINHVDAILQNMPQLSQQTTTLLLVGGFANCSFVRDAISKRFSDNKILVPPENSAYAVLKGAILFGRDPSIIQCRTVKHTYGIEYWPPFDPQVHSEDKKKEIEGKWVCEGVFRKHVKAGSIATVGVPMDEIKYTAVDTAQDEMCLPIFMSNELSPMYVTDDSCTYLGTLLINMKDIARGIDRAVYVRMIFEGTEFAVEARCGTTNVVAHTKVDFLG